MTITTKKSSFWIRLTSLLVLLLFFSPLAPQPRQKKEAACKNCFSANFRDVEIKEWLKTMANITKRNILVDDKVRGKITIVSHRKIPESRALDFMKQVLEVKGYGIIEEPYLLKIVPHRKAGEGIQPSEEDGLDPKASGVVTHVLTIPQEIKLQEMSTVVKGVVSKNVTVVSYQPTNTLVLTGYHLEVSRAVKITEKLIAELEKLPEIITKSDASVHIYTAQHIQADSLAGVLSRLDAPVVTPPDLPKARPDARQQPRRATTKIKAVAHKESNSVVVTASAAEWLEIESIIRRLDVERSQVLLEVLIAEVRSTKTNDFGIDWRFLRDGSPTAQFNSGFAASGGLIDSEGQITGNNTLNGFSLGFLEVGGDLLALLNANISNENFHVLSSPQILTLDNQEAEINVGQDVPVRTQERTSGGGTAESTINSFEYRKSGITLKITPHVNPAEQISVDLFGEITNIVGSGGTATTNPTFSKRNIKTYVVVHNKQTIVIGGLVSSQKNKTVVKVPFLGDIPLLGYLFRRTIDDTSRTNLMIFLTPHILQSRAEADRVTRYKRSRQLKSLKKRDEEIIIWPEQPITTE